jgi:TolB-like protein/DNA-binding winged helix-turn-helix (wHTH) protein/Tfp pilus assembly protein PilF
MKCSNGLSPRNDEPYRVVTIAPLFHSDCLRVILGGNFLPMASASQTRRIRFGAFEVDVASNELFKNGIRLKLQDQPFQILTVLLEHPGVLISREELRRKLWADDTFVDFDAGMNAAIRRLRDALNDSADHPRYIQTLHRHGYRFMADVETIDVADDPVVAKAHSGHAVSGSLESLSTVTKPVSASVVTRGMGLKIRWLLGFALTLALATIVTIGAVRWRHRLFATHASNGIQSVAVLPLQNLSGDPSQEYFADGMTDALITDLAQTKSFRVISRTSAMHYKGTHKKLPEIAKELNVDAVVEGVVIRSGDRVRIDAQLIQADNDQHLWARSYDREITDVLALQADVAQAIAMEIEGKLTPEAQLRMAAKKQAVDPKVYEAYLKGRYFAGRSTQEELKKSVEYFREAIRLDPGYAPAYSGLADVYSFMGFGWANGIDHPELLAIEAARKAISLDDSVSEAHTSLGWVLHRHMQDWTGAENEYRRAIQLNPNSAKAHGAYGAFQRSIGQDDLACSEFQLAHELDPVSAGSAPGWARCLYESNHFDEAVRMMQGIVEMNPDSAPSRWSLGEIYERKGMFPEAIEQYQKGADVTQRNFIMVSLMASAYAGWGKRAEAQKLHEELIRGGEDKWISAVFHVRMGQNETAIRELTEDTAECGPGTCGPASSLYVSEWRFGPLRSDPRFQALLKKFNYPQSAFKN